MGEFNNLNNTYDGERLLTEDLKPLTWEQWKSQVMAEANITTISEGLSAWLFDLYNHGATTRNAALVLKQK